MKPVRVGPTTLLGMAGFKNNWARMIVMTRHCVTNKNRVARLKVKVKVLDYTQTLFIGYNKRMFYPAHSFFLHGGISKLHDKTSVACEDHVVIL